MIKNNIKLIRDKALHKERLIITIIMVSLILSMSVGYALYQSELNTLSEISLDIENNIFIKDIEVVEKSNVHNDSIKESVNKTNDRVEFKQSFNLSFQEGMEDYITLKYTFINKSNKTWYFSNYEDNSTLSSPRVIGLDYEDEIEPGETREVKVIYFKENVHSSLEVLIEPTFTFTKILPDNKRGSILVNLENKDFVYKDSNEYISKLNILNSNFFSIKYKLKSSNPNIILNSDYSNILNAFENYSSDISFNIKEGITLPSSTNIALITEDGKEYNLGKINVSN